MPVPRIAPDCQIRRVSFIPAQEGLSQIGYALETGMAAPKIVVHDGQGKIRTCASAMTSDQGHMLTAAHCVEGCLSAQGVYQAGLQGSTLDTAKLGAAECTIDVNGVPTKAKVLAVSRCKFDEAWGGVKACSGVDYAVLKIDPVPGAQASHCLDVAVDAPTAGASVSALSYPPQTQRKPVDERARDVTDHAQYMALGKVIEPRTTCLLKSNQGDQWVDIAIPQIVERMQERVRAGALLQTSVDMVKGASGAGLFDVASGQIVGIGSTMGRVKVQGTYSECQGATFFTSTAAMLREVHQNFPAINLDAVFSCPRAKLPR